MDRSNSRRPDLDDAAATLPPRGRAVAPWPVAVQRLERRRMLSGVSGHLIYDYDVDGVADAGEGGAAGFIVYVDVNDNGLREAGEPAATSDPAGSYAIDVGAMSGTLRVRLEDRPAWGYVVPATGARAVQIPAAGGQVGDIDFLVSDRSVFTGKVFHDLDLDATAEAGEPPLAGWTVFVDLNHNHTIDPGEPTTQSDAAGVWAMNLAGAGPDPNHRHYHFVQILPEGWHRTTPAFSDLYTVITRAGRVFGGLDYGARKYAAVQGRHVFYDNSAYDGRAAGADERDDAAIAPMIPSGGLRSVIRTSYSRGLNGVMVDVAGSWGMLTPDDFVVRIGRGGDVATWAAGATPAVTVRPGAGIGGTDRVTLVWPDGAIRNSWLELTVRATPRTGLATAQVLYFGNLVGDVAGNSSRVDAADLVAVRRAGPRTAAGVGDPFDVNRDGRINALDESAIRRSLGRSLEPITLPTAASQSVATSTRKPIRPRGRDLLRTR